MSFMMLGDWAVSHLSDLIPTLSTEPPRKELSTELAAPASVHDEAIPYLYQSLNNDAEFPVLSSNNIHTAN